MLLIGIKYSKCDLACDVISYCASSFAIRKKIKSSLHDQLVI